jgi:maleate isomerase
MTATGNVADLTGTAQFDPPGTRRAIGVIAPYDFALDDEYWRWLPPGVSLCVTRTPYLDLPVSVEMAEAVSSVPDITAAARALIEARPAAVLYACTSGSFVGGMAGERSLRAAIAAAAGCPAVTPSGGLLDALSAVGARTLAVGTPYDAEVTVRLSGFLAEAGHDTIGCAYLGLSADIARVDAGTVRRLARAADSPAADALFLSCTNLRTFGVLEDLERDLGKPVLSANQVGLWAALRAAGIAAPPAGQRLFESAAPP